MTNRILPCVGSVAVVAQLFFFLGCGGSNGPVTTTGTAGTTGSAAGTTGSAAGTTGSGSAGTTGSGSAGTTGSGSAGTTGTGGTGTTGFGQPACGNTVSTMVAIAKGGTCTSADPQLCYKTCGPEKTGVKSETCQSSGTYAEMSGCSFDPTGDYTCYKIPTAANAACPAGVSPKGSDPCTTDHCVICNSLGGIVGGNYLDSTGASKVGYCTCQVANSSGARVWTCASDTAWPCPAGAGC